MREQEIIYNFDHHTKKLVITTRHELIHPSDKEQVVGSREVKDYYTEEGIKAMITSLNAQKVSYEKQKKNLDEQLRHFGDLSVDAEFLKKIKEVQDMQKKEQTTEQIRNAEEAITEINKQLREVKSVVKNHIKM